MAGANGNGAEIGFDLGSSDVDLLMDTSGVAVLDLAVIIHSM